MAANQLVCNCEDERQTTQKPKETLEDALRPCERCHVQGSEAAEKLWIGGCACLRFVVSKVGIIAAVGDACSSRKRPEAGRYLGMIDSFQPEPSNFALASRCSITARNSWLGWANKLAASHFQPMTTLSHFLQSNNLIVAATLCHHLYNSCADAHQSLT